MTLYLIKNVISYALKCNNKINQKIIWFVRLCISLNIPGVVKLFDRATLCQKVKTNVKAQAPVKRNATPGKRKGISTGFRQNKSTISSWINRRALQNAENLSKTTKTGCRGPI